MNKRIKRIIAFMLIFVMAFNFNALQASAAKIKLSSKSISLDEGAKKTITLKKGSMKVKSGVKWSSSNKAVAKVSKGTITAVSEGSATITAKYKKKSYKCQVTVNAVVDDSTTEVNDTTRADVTTESNTTTEASVTTEVAATTEEVTTEEATTEMGSDFDFKRDVKIEYGTTIKHIDFDMKVGSNGEPDPAEVAELEAQGCTVNGKNVTKDQVCETAKYTFTKLPTTLEDIESFFAEAEPNDGTYNYGGFNAMAATICAACTFAGGSNPSDPFFSKDPVRSMFEYINGPNIDIARSQMDNAITSMKSAIQACGSNVYKSYFNGATPENNYTPSEPFVLEMYKGPYYIEGKETITGDRPTTYMILVKSNGADSERYIDVYHSEVADRWFSYDNQFMHVIANDFKAPKKKL